MWELKEANSWLLLGAPFVFLQDIAQSGWDHVVIPHRWTGASSYFVGKLHKLKNHSFPWSDPCNPIISFQGALWSSADLTVQLLNTDYSSFLAMVLSSAWDGLNVSWGPSGKWKENEDFWVLTQILLIFCVVLNKAAFNGTDPWKEDRVFVSQAKPQWRVGRVGEAVPSPHCAHRPLVNHCQALFLTHLPLFSGGQKRAFYPPGKALMVVHVW